MKRISIAIICLLIGCYELNAQVDDLELMLEKEVGPVKDETKATFLSTFVLSNPSVEMLDKKGINMRISHKFGFLNSGSESFYGFDNSSSYIGLDYAPLNRINVGIGRSTFRKSVNSHIKINVFRQSKGYRSIPLTIALYGELDYRTQKYFNSDLQEDRLGRIEYSSQLLIARKFGNIFSLQLMPTFIHRNLVETENDTNNIYALGIGGTLRLQKVLRLNFEYFWVSEHDTPKTDYYSPISFGICYQTSRHAFELFATNSTGITANNNIAFTTGNFWKGDIGIGFNISIIFSVNR
jgi:hypothetical protein